MKLMIAIIAGIIGLVSMFQSKRNDIWLWVGQGEDPFKKN